MSKYDTIVVGCGFAGTVMARQMAEKGKSVLVLDKRNHIGGNMYDSLDSNGVLVHWYGPHIFHTNSKIVFDYLNKFSKWYPYQHKVVGKIDGVIVPIPFNFTSLEKMFSPYDAEMIKLKLKESYPEIEAVSILELLNSQDTIVKKFGEYVFDKVFIHYTAKQWGTTIEKVDSSVINRVPVVLGYRDTYFSDKYQFMPEEGFTKLFENMLNHENITVQLETNAREKICFDENTSQVYFDGEVYDSPIIYTGAIDELLGFKYGYLPYRSLNLCFERYALTTYQEFAVVNYTTSEDYTRITEFKYITNQQINQNTTILKEYPQMYNPKVNIAFYPIIDKVNLELFNKYKNYLSMFKNIYLCGRLAEYKYYNMDAVIEHALILSDNLKL